MASLLAATPGKVWRGWIDASRVDPAESNEAPARPRTILLQALRGRRHLRAQAAKEPVQGVRRGQHLPAQSDQEQVQDVHSRQGRVHAAGSRGALGTPTLDSANARSFCPPLVFSDLRIRHRNILRAWLCPRFGQLPQFVSRRGLSNTAHIHVPSICHGMAISKPSYLRSISIQTNALFASRSSNTNQRSQAEPNLHAECRPSD